MLSDPQSPTQLTEQARHPEHTKLAHPTSMGVGRPRSPLLGTSLSPWGQALESPRAHAEVNQKFHGHCETQRSLLLTRFPPPNFPTRLASPCPFLTLSRVPHPKDQSYLIPPASLRSRPRDRCPGYIGFNRSTTVGNVTLCWEHPLLPAYWISHFFFFPLSSLPLGYFTCYSLYK